MNNVVEFGKPQPKPARQTFIVETNTYVNQDGEFEVSMEIGDGVDDSEVFEALLAVAMKFATEQNLHEDGIELEPEGPANDN